MLKITVREGPDAGQELTPNSDTVVIGRGDVCDLVLSDSAVSRRHCALQREEDHFILADLQSANGTFLNDLQTRIDSRVLKNGDEIVIGTSRLRIEFSSPSEGAVPPESIDPTGTENLPGQNPTRVAPLSPPHQAEDATAIAPVAIPAEDEAVTRVRPCESARPRIILRVIEGKDAGARFEPPPGARSISIGRGKEADFRLREKAVSRIHAIVRSTAAGWELVDNNSLNGTFVEQCSERVDRLELKGGEKIRVAETLLEVEFVPAEEG
ncbi:MAG TPA: FHA domain-containing protein [Candidatus Binatia bacterium]|jgi:pSer/pThr/pTyr-binding forkhead associated (FHA) protein|nr:FHA domain-containing protein [Candidatus Binatia bacterium]